MDDVATEEVTLAELLDSHFDSRMGDLNVAFPAKVESFDTATQTIECTPQLNRTLPDGAGNFVTETLPKIADVPVVFQRCKGFFMSFPLKKGDFVLVICCQRSLSAWRKSGQQGDPGDLGMFTLNGAVAIPGVYPDSSALRSVDGDHMIMGSDTDPRGQIVLTPTQVQIAQGTQFAALANLVKARLDTVQGAFDAHTHPVSGAATGVPISLIGALASVAASDVKIS